MALARRFAPLFLTLAACSGNGGNTSSSGTDGISIDDPLVDPQTCKECHPNHFQQWLGSMHAYAAEDPVFRAMNARGQRETNGELGDFCIKCHAPLAVEFGLTKDGLNLDEVPQKLQGVTCYFCHNVEEVTGTHNNPLTPALDGVMRGNVQDPVESAAHASAYDPHLDGRTLKSADVCGACHDIVTPKGVHLERTYAEWLFSFFSNPDPLQPQFPDQAMFGLTCANCHMDGTPDTVIADAPGVAGDRTYHDHRFVGVDVALTPWPDAAQAPALEADQRAGIDEVRETVLCGSLCVKDLPSGESEVVLWLHNEFAGHHWPSGAMQDRRAWVELIAYDGMDQVMFSSGAVADGDPVTALDDPNLWLFRDEVFDGQGNEVHMFWEAESYTESNLPVASEFFGDTATWTPKAYPLLPTSPARVTSRVRIRAMGLEVIDDLIASGDLDPALRAKFETFDIPPVQFTWTPGEAEVSDAYGSCVSSGPACRSPFLDCGSLFNEEICGMESRCSWDGMNCVAVP